MTIATQRWPLVASGVVVLVAILALQLLVPPVVGLADNGDFWRVWGRFGIHAAPDVPPEQRYFAYLIRDWLVDPALAVDTEFHAPDAWQVELALRLSSLFADSGHFDIRSLALVRMALFAGAAALILHAAARVGVRPWWAALAVLAIVFCDSGYAAYFNSGYGEASTFLFTLYAAAFFLRLAMTPTPAWLDLAGFVVSGVLLIGSKPQNVVLALPLALLAVRIGTAHRNARWWLGTALGVIALAWAAHGWRASPPPLFYQQAIRHIAVFNAILVASPDRAADLDALGLPRTLVDLAGRFPWDPAAVARHDELQASFHPVVTERTIAAFLLRHPQRVRHLLGLAAPRALALHTGLGNFEVAAGRGPHAVATSWAWRSRLAEIARPASLRSLALAAAACLLVAAFYWRRAQSASGRLLAEGTACLLACATIQYALVATLQGPLFVEKGMFAFVLYSDASLLAAAAMAGTLAMRRS